jgi:hypothetical protein
VGAGNLDRAILLHEQTLADRQRVLGADHPGTLTSRNNVAHVYQAAGNVAFAVTQFEQAVAAVVRALGEEHPVTRTVPGQPRRRHH